VYIVSYVWNDEVIDIEQIRPPVIFAIIALLHEIDPVRPLSEYGSHANGKQDDEGEGNG